MVIELIEGSIESRVVHVLLEMYPVTKEDLVRELKIRVDVLDRALRGLASRGVVEIEDLPDRTYVRLLRMDFSFAGLKESQRRRVKHRGRRPEKPGKYDGPMYG